MIKIIEGNLLESKADIIAHQVNCKNAMNSGVAKQIKIKYPWVFTIYSLLCGIYKNKPYELLGQCQMVHINDNQRVANLFGQLNYGYDGKQYTDLQALKKSMVQLRNDYLKKDHIVAFPYKIGCARGGASWDDVYKIIEEVFNDYNVEIWKLDME